MDSSSSPTPSFAIGIDFGTTFCCVAVLRHPDQTPEIIQSDVGKNTTPSYVTYNLNEDRDKEDSDEDESDIYAGEAAKEVASQNPETTIFDVKRLIGRSSYDPYIQKYQKFWPFHLVNVTGLVGVKVGDESLLPQVIAKELISHLKKTAENYLGAPINSAVVTIPVYYNDMQKDLTRGACEDAGFTSVHFLAEPVAAAIAYGLQNSLQSTETKTCLIFDLGGGTFDVIVFKLDSNKRVEIKASGGDDRLGGEDFNDLLTEYCLEEFRKKHGINLAEGKTSSNEQVRKKTAKRLRRIRHECERQKCFLTSTLGVVVSLDGVHEQHQLVVPVTRKTFEALIDPLLTKAIHILDETLVKSGYKKGEIDDVVLIGGSSRIPKVQRMVQDYFEGRQPLHRSIDADEAVASGAAIYAHNILNNTNALFTIVTSIKEERQACNSQGLNQIPELKTSNVLEIQKQLQIETRTETKQIDEFNFKLMHHEQPKLTKQCNVVEDPETQHEKQLKLKAKTRIQFMQSIQMQEKAQLTQKTKKYHFKKDEPQNEQLKPKTTPEQSVVKQIKMPKQAQLTKQLTALHLPVENQPNIIRQAKKQFGLPLTPEELELHRRKKEKIAHLTEQLKALQQPAENQPNIIRQAKKQFGLPLTPEELELHRRKKEKIAHLTEQLKALQQPAENQPNIIRQAKKQFGLPLTPEELELHRRKKEKIAHLTEQLKALQQPAENQPNIIRQAKKQFGLPLTPEELELHRRKKEKIAHLTEQLKALQQPAENQPNIIRQAKKQFGLPLTPEELELHRRKKEKIAHLTEQLKALQQPAENQPNIIRQAKKQFGLPLTPEELELHRRKKEKIAHLTEQLKALQQPAENQPNIIRQAKKQFGLPLTPEELELHRRNKKKIQTYQNKLQHCSNQ